MARSNLDQETGVAGATLCAAGAMVDSKSSPVIGERVVLGAKLDGESTGGKHG